MKVLVIGDIVGSVGRKVALENIQKLKEKYPIDLVIANGENSAHGKGITNKIYNQLLAGGVDCITMGNHTFSKDAIYNFIDDAENMVRPVNMLPTNIGKNYWIKEINGLKVAVINLIGEVFMYNVDASPFSTMEKMLNKIDADIFIVDFHGEATSEKIAFAYKFSDRIQAVLGTHTHVQTADEQIINKCAYISDIGMCGVYRSVIGCDVENTLKRFTTNEKTKYMIAEGDGIFNAVLIDIDEKLKAATHIERIQIRPN